MNEQCLPQIIIDTLEAIDNNDDKNHYIDNILSFCNPCDRPIPAVSMEDFLPKDKPAKPVKAVKKKKKLSGYNCYVKTEVKKGRPFSEVVESRDWAGLNDKARANWNLLAKRDCPGYLWEKEYNVENMDI